MTREGHRITLPREKLTQGLALAILLLLMALAIAGPSGLLAWGENARLLEQRQTRIAELVEERDALKNRVDLLDPAQADPDLVGEQLRQNFNVVHPDELVLILDETGE
ncbi:septum formation initiator [Altererythrobacter marinus]|uniref:Septum formation initiator n=1 Tax=Pelagerythrobacter marinus TaxID=538382 RepID=A0ABW9UW34_9SPHN|nr:septum formation initiator family protein [Pelagerythrobacter marinus]MXO68166.1 septum formation initiator [Pelagerythrobacter marinus]